MKRVLWIDSLRGWAILAVILGHLTAQLPWDALAPSIGQMITGFLGPMRLGLIVFVSGLFVDSGLKKGKELYFKSKVQSILWPFMVWSSVYGFLKLYFSSLVNNQYEPLNLLLSTITGGQSTIWFLYSLFIFFILIPVVRKAPIYLVIPACWYLSYISPIIPDDSIFSGVHNGRIRTFFILFPFFYLGDWLTLNNKNIISLFKSKPIFISSAIAAIVLLALRGTEHFITKDIVMLALPLLSIPIFVIASSLTEIKPIIFIGKNSIVFYVLHQLLIQATAKFVPNQSVIFNSSLGYLAILISILLFCYFVCLLRKYIFIDLLFSFKLKRKRYQQELLY